MIKMNKVLVGYKFVANFLDVPADIGMIFKMDDRQFIPVLHFNDVFPDILLSKLTKTGTKGSIKFNQSRDVSISFGGSTNPSVGKSEVTISFKKKRSVAGVLNDAAVDELRYGPILSQLKEIWTSKGYGKFLHDYIFVYSTVTAASGSLIYSEESNNTVKLAHQSGEGVTKLADLGSGNFEYLSNTKSTLEIIRAVAHKPLFKAFTFRKNWEPEILG